MSTNQYGLDVHYFKKNLEKILLEIDCYTPEEMKLALSRLSQTASTAQLKHGLKEAGYVSKTNCMGEILIGKK
jgi:hypothetical protein